MKRLVLTVFALLTISVTAANAQVWQASSQGHQMPLWPGTAPDALPAKGPETAKQGGESTRPVVVVENVSRPTLTIYSPKGRNTGVSVIVFPGGGYQILAMDLEGTEVCDWLTAKGITCILLKYRVPNPMVYWDDKCKCRPPETIIRPLQDAQRAISLARFHSAEWRIDPHKIGVLGFSAGGHMVAAVSTHFEQRTYPAVDAADQESARPDFAVALYPGHLSMAKNSLELNPNIATRITPETPPTFLLQNEDDNVDRIEDSISYYFGLKKAGVSVELHAYAQGGHAFGLRPSKFPVTKWPDLVETWLGTIGMLDEK